MQDRVQTGVTLLLQEDGEGVGGRGGAGGDAAASAILEPEEDGVGCMSTILHPFSPPAPKRFIRTIKPVAGSSFNVRALCFTTHPRMRGGSSYEVLIQETLVTAVMP